MQSNWVICCILIAVQSICYGQDFSTIDVNELPETNRKILHYLDSLRLIGDQINDPDFVENALRYANALPPVGESYGENYTDLHLLIPGDIIYLYENFDIKSSDPKQIVSDYSSMYNKPLIIDNIIYHEILGQYYGSSGPNSPLQITGGMIDLNKILIDKVKFYHPKPL